MKRILGFDGVAAVAPRAQPPGRVIAVAEQGEVDRPHHRAAAMVKPDDGAEERQPMCQAHGAVNGIQKPLKGRVGLVPGELLADDPVLGEAALDERPQSPLHRQIDISDEREVGLAAHGTPPPQPGPYDSPGLVGESVREIMQ